MKMSVKLYDEEDCMIMPRYLGQAAPEISPGTSNSVCLPVGTLGQISNTVGMGGDVMRERFSDYSRPDENSRKVAMIVIVVVGSYNIALVIGRTSYTCHVHLRHPDMCPHHHLCYAGTTWGHNWS